MTDDILTILQQLCPDLDVEAFLIIAGGRQWYVPTVHSYRRVRRYRAILAFPSRDYKVVSHHLGCSVGMVYRAWNSTKAS